MLSMNKQSKTILIVEDSQEEYEITYRALRKTGFANPIKHFSEGKQVLDYLNKRNEYEENKNSKTGVILLDLNLPDTAGFNVLAEIKRNPVLKSIPVLILTSSSDEQDIRTCYEFGANSFITKPMEFDNFLKIVQNIKDYWFDVVELPDFE